MCCANHLTDLQICTTLAVDVLQDALFRAYLHNFNHICISLVVQLLCNLTYFTQLLHTHRLSGYAYHPKKKEFAQLLALQSAAGCANRPCFLTFAQSKPQKHNRSRTDTFILSLNDISASSQAPPKSINSS